MDDLSRKSILVLGGASGIGAETVRQCAARGAKVYLQYHSRKEAAEALVDELEMPMQKIELVQGDLTVESDILATFSKISEDLTSIVHSVSAPLPVSSFHKESWLSYQNHFEVSVSSLYFVLKYFLSNSNKNGLDSVVSVSSSVVDGAPPKNMAPYTVAKAALEGLCRSMAVELAPQGIRVNCVSPTLTPTDLTAHLDQHQQDFLARMVPLGRLCNARDVASAIAFLLSDQATFVTGLTLPLAGGTVMK